MYVMLELVGAMTLLIKLLRSFQAEWEILERHWGRWSRNRGLTAAALLARAGHSVVLPGVEVVRRQDRTLIDAGGARYGPYDRIVSADVARVLPPSLAATLA
jgi:hypothetical protein